MKLRISSVAYIYIYIRALISNFFFLVRSVRGASVMTGTAVFCFIFHVEVWELKFYFYPSAGGFKKKKKKKKTR